LGSEHHVGRRTFVGLLAAGWATGVALANDVVRPARADATVAGRSAPEVDGVVVLGRAYLADHPSEADAEFLLRHLPDLDAERKVRPQLPDLAPAVARDLRAGRVVSVQGWQLSQSEARAAAAVALGR
jgi:hypothetical protein